MAGTQIVGFKRDLPRKDCAACGRPFAWRRKWARCWNEVKYCSNRCRRAGKPKEDERVAAT